MDLTPQELWTLRNIIVRAVTDCQEVLSGAARRVRSTAAKPLAPAAAPPSSLSIPPASSPPPARAAIDEKRLTYGIKDTARVLGISRSLIYRLISSGELRVLHIGKRTLIEAASIKDLLARGREGARGRGRRFAHQIVEDAPRETADPGTSRPNIAAGP